MPYLAIDSTRWKGKRYTHGDEVPAELATKLPKGYTVEEFADLRDDEGERRSVLLLAGAQPLSGENPAREPTVTVSDSNGVHEEGASTTVKSDTVKRPTAARKS